MVAARLGCTVSVDEATSKALGLDGVPVVKNGKLEFTCTAIGSGKIRISSSTANSGADKSEHSIGKMDFSREISIVSRPYASTNGGWF